MSAAIPGHVQPESSTLISRSHPQPAITESAPYRASHMEQATQPRPGRTPTTGDVNTSTVDGDSSLQNKPSERGGTKQVDRRSVDYIVRSGIAGGLAGCAAKTVVAPLDRVKILFQTSNPQFAKYTGSWFGLVSAIRGIKQQEGARGLFKGHSATLLRIFPYAAIKFLAYEQIRGVIIPSRDKETPFRRLISGSLAGVTSVFFTYPLELIRVRLAFETKRSSRSSVADTFRQIYHERASPASAPSNLPAGKAPIAAAIDGVTAVASKAVPSHGFANFYRGFGPTILGMLPYAGMSFLTHDTVGDWLRSPTISKYTTIPGSEDRSRRGTRRPQLTAAAELFSGALAGVVSQTTSYPLEVIRRRMQVGGVVGDGHRMKIGETARIILMEKGFRGFFVGLTIGYIKVIPLAATSFFVYERLKWSLGI